MITRRRSFGSHIAVFTAVLVVGACGEQQPSQSANAGPSAAHLQYQILSREIYDIPLKTQVSIALLVPADIRRDDLVAVLQEVYQTTSTETGFKYRRVPSHIFIYAYPSREHAASGMGQWLGMIDRVGEQDVAHLTVSEERLAVHATPPQARFGLTEEKRKLVFQEIVEAEDRAAKEAEARHPTPDPLKPGYSQAAVLRALHKEQDLKEQLESRYKRRLNSLYHLTHKQLAEISSEGVKKNWPLPKSPS
jgi:ribosomal protein S10